MTAGRRAVYLLPPLLVAVVIRAIYGWQYWRELPFARAPVVDAEIYLHLARELRAGEWRDPELLYHSFLYPYALALFPVPGAGANLAIMVAQLALGVLNTWLVMRIVALLWRERWLALASGIAFALTSPLLFLETKFYPDTLAMTFLLLVLRQLVAPTRPWLLGSSTGLLVLVRTEALLLVPVALYRVWYGEDGAAGRARAVSGIVLPVILCLGAAAVRNSLVAGAFVPSPTVVGGIVFLQGNNPKAAGTYAQPEGFDGMIVNERAIAKRLAEQAAGHPLTPVAVDRYWWRQGLDYLAANPRRALELLGLKLVTYLDVREVMLDLGFYSERDELPLLRLMVLGFPVLLLLAGLGLVADRVERPARPGRDAIALAILPSLIVCLVFFTHTRYRLSGLAAALVLAPRGLPALAALLRAGGRRLVFGGVLCGVLTGLLVRGQVLDEGPGDRALAHYNEGIAYDRLGDQGKALTHFARAFEVASGHPDVRNNYARALFAAGRRDEAQAVLQEGIAADPSATLLRVSLGWMQLQQGRAPEAERQLREALRREPTNVGAKLALAFALREQARDRETLLSVADMFREVLEANTVTYTRLSLLGLGTTYALLQRGDEIDPLFRRMAELQPLDSSEESSWGDALYNVGRYSEAEAHQRRAVDLGPGNAVAFYRLALVEQALGRPEAARAHFEKARSLGLQGVGPR